MLCYEGSGPDQNIWPPDLEPDMLTLTLSREAVATRCLQQPVCPELTLRPRRCSVVQAWHFPKKLWPAYLEELQFLTSST